MRRAPAPVAPADPPYSSFVDLFTGLIFIFLLLVCILVLEQGLARADTQRRAGAFVKGLAERLQGEGIAVEVSGETLRFPEAILFESGEYELGPDARRSVGVLRSLVVEALASNGSKGPDGLKAPPGFEAIVIEGHADGRPYSRAGPVRDNLALSVLRASAVYRELVGDGPPGLGTRLPARRVSAAGYGASRPLAGVSGGNQPRNRRIEIRFLFSEK